MEFRDSTEGIAFDIVTEHFDPRGWGSGRIVIITDDIIYVNVNGV